MIHSELLGIVMNGKTGSELLFRFIMLGGSSEDMGH